MKKKKTKSRYTRQLDLEKERLMLKMKQQELEIQKSVVKLKGTYHPVNIATNFALDLIDGSQPMNDSEWNTNDSDSDKTNLSAKTQISKHRRKRSKAMLRLGDIFTSLLIILEGFFEAKAQRYDKQQGEQEYTDSTNKSEKQNTSKLRNNKNESEEYIIGKDDV